MSPGDKLLRRARSSPLADEGRRDDESRCSPRRLCSTHRRRLGRRRLGDPGDERADRAADSVLTGAGHLQTLGLALVVALLGTRLGTLATIAYLAEGATGLPVFAQHQGGFIWLFGPSAGYLWAFPAAAFAMGRMFDLGLWRSPLGRFLAVALATALVFAVVGVARALRWWDRPGARRRRRAVRCRRRAQVRRRSCGRAARSTLRTRAGPADEIYSTRSSIETFQRNRNLCHSLGRVLRLI